MKLEYSFWKCMHINKIERIQWFILFANNIFSHSSGGLTSMKNLNRGACLSAFLVNLSIIHGVFHWSSDVIRKTYGD